MVEFDFIRRILKARFQKFFKENKPAVSIETVIWKKLPLSKFVSIRVYSLTKVQSVALQSCSKITIRLIRVINFVDFSTARHSSNEFGSVQALNEKFVFVNLIRLICVRYD